MKYLIEKSNDMFKNHAYDEIRDKLNANLEDELDIFTVDLTKDEVSTIKNNGGSVHVNFNAAIPSRFHSLLSERTENNGFPYSLDGVLDQVKAKKAWDISTGKDVTIAIIDSGVCPDLKEVPIDRRLNINIETNFFDNHWKDEEGHGSMCAAIAAGAKKNDTGYNGVAPDAIILSVRTDLSAYDLTRTYRKLIDAKKSGKIVGPLVINNSYSLEWPEERDECPKDHPFVKVVLEAIENDITVVFAAGNNHYHRNNYDSQWSYNPVDSFPSTIWGANSLDPVICVSTVNAYGSNQTSETDHFYSSRGPGQWSDVLRKPDCVAPTYGTVRYGCDDANDSSWSTSGACALVSGLVALLLSKNPSLSPGEVADIIRRTCTPLDGPPECVGSGMINCLEAISQVPVARKKYAV